MKQILPRLSESAFTRMVLDLPYPPSINHYWRRVGAKTLISREGRLFRQEVGYCLAGVQALAGDLEISIGLYPPDRRRRDVDNTIKALLDALQHGGAYADDSQISKLTVERLTVVPGGKSLVELRSRV